ncbi:hypothetical protein COTS27_01184 [Spirochaetota bacterium]|nr:hypothetical protein COTS27_01184 [Spirochaetota bacterium]
MTPEDSLTLKIIKFMAYYQNAIIRKIPNFITNRFPPLLMGKPQLRRSHSNTANIPTTLTSQAICAKHCGNCPSNPFTHGGLYCTSGKSSKPVAERGCHCFECELFEKCGGLGYFCKFGSADQMQKNPTLGSDLNVTMSPASTPKKERSEAELAETESLLMKASKSPHVRGDAYHYRFIKSLIDQKEQEISRSQKTAHTTRRKKSKKTIQIKYDNISQPVSAPYGKSILEISLANNIPHTHVCGGRAKCSTCKVLVLSGRNNLSPRNADEKLIAIRKQFPPQVRLACQTIPQGDISIRPIIKNQEDILKSTQADNETTNNFFCIDAHVAVLFTDIRSFTTFSEKNLAYDVVQILNDYFTEISKPIDKYGGYIDKYMGDGIMAIFGLETKKHSPEQASLLAAFEINQALKNFNKKLLEKYQHQFHIGIGIDAGEVVIAKLGSNLKSQLTAIGDIVNTSARIESATKEHAAEILVSHNVYKTIHNNFTWGKKISSQLKGKISFTTLHEPLAEISKHSSHPA